MKEMTKSEALAELRERHGMLPFAGGDGTVVHAANVATPYQYPLGPPTVAGDGGITVPRYLNEPTRVTRVIQDLTLQRFLLDQLFSSDGGVSGGAVVYDLPDANDLYADRDFQKVEPGSEFPILTVSAPVPQTAVVEKWGAKVFITDEARDRNDQSGFMNQMRKMANTLVRKLNQRAVETIDAILTSYPSQVIPGHNWTTVTTQGTSPTAYSSQPIGDFVAIQLYNEQMELGMEHDTLIMNPQERARLQLIYGSEWSAVLREYGYSSTFVSNRVTAGTAYSVAKGQLGSLRIEQPLTTETWREQGRQMTWIQTSVRPLLYVKDPFAVIKLTGLAG